MLRSGKEDMQLTDCRLADVELGALAQHLDLRKLALVDLRADTRSWFWKDALGVDEFHMLVYVGSGVLHDQLGSRWDYTGGSYQLPAGAVENDGGMDPVPKYGYEHFGREGWGEGGRGLKIRSGAFRFYTPARQDHQEVLSLLHFLGQTVISPQASIP